VPNISGYQPSSFSSAPSTASYDFSLPPRRHSLVTAVDGDSAAVASQPSLPSASAVRPSYALAPLGSHASSSSSDSENSSKLANMRRDTRAVGPLEDSTNKPSPSMDRYEPIHSGGGMRGTGLTGYLGVGNLPTSGAFSSAPLTQPPAIQSKLQSTAMRDTARSSYFP
jgi:hypothetical protein